MAIVLINEIPTEVGSGADEIIRLREELAQQTAVIEQMREALQLCRSHMYCHASNTGDNAFDKLCSALALQPCRKFAEDELENPHYSAAMNYAQRIEKEA